tara:strand:- start:585 stop:851 length:267 start_codon:yes stop_codon:yes gene_type:complete
MLKVKRAGLGFPALFFYPAVWRVTPNNCSFQQVTALSSGHLTSVEQLFTQEAGQQGADLPILKLPEQLYGIPIPISPIPIRFTGDLPA